MSIVIVAADDLVQLIEAACRRVFAEQHAHDEWIDTGTASALTGEHPKTTARRARTGEIPARRLGNAWRFKRTDIVAYLERISR